MTLGLAGVEPTVSILEIIYLDLDGFYSIRLSNDLWRYFKAKLFQRKCDLQALAQSQSVIM